ncbi:hypothetical protein VCUG_02320 [Vavraia culicis subsp. floridensis]|uniref:Uncharacterized protein n=1 Tax=Vavraia culicis (isolate floridensis) TaxID=948595 RepID=L2GRC5_VAVCU|nr:uncharacterized protein VCUG_02320 [Vavraia culicis subsp. floridensis]ELA46184.1 hypothetical protein VCUG_02320 [Vavraia culicis subsp. floridensis]
MPMSSSSDIEIVCQKKKDGDIEVMSVIKKKERGGKCVINLRGQGKEGDGVVDGYRPDKRVSCGEMDGNRSKNVNYEEVYGREDKHGLNDKKKCSSDKIGECKGYDGAQEWKTVNCGLNENKTDEMAEFCMKDIRDRKITGNTKRFKGNEQTVPESMARTGRSGNITVQDSTEQVLDRKIRVEGAPIANFNQQSADNDRSNVQSCLTATTTQAVVTPASTSTPSDQITFTALHNTTIHTFIIPSSSTLKPVYDMLCKNTPNKMQFGHNFVSRFSSLRVLNIKNGDVVQIIDPTKRSTTAQPMAHEGTAAKRMVKVNYAVNKSVEIELVHGDDLNAMITRVNGVLNDEYRYFVVNGERCAKNEFEDGDVIDVFK